MKKVDEYELIKTYGDDYDYDYTYYFGDNHDYDYNDYGYDYDYGDNWEPEDYPCVYNYKREEKDYETF